MEKYHLRERVKTTSDYCLFAVFCIVGGGLIDVGHLFVLLWYKNLAVFEPLWLRSKLLNF